MGPIDRPGLHTCHISHARSIQANMCLEHSSLDASSPMPGNHRPAGRECSCVSPWHSEPPEVTIKLPDRMMCFRKLLSVAGYSAQVGLAAVYYISTWPALFSAGRPVVHSYVFLSFIEGVRDKRYSGQLSSYCNA